MTTIAIKDGYMVADGLACDGNMVTNKTAVKVIRLKGCGSLMGKAGRVGGIEEVADAFDRGELPKITNDEDVFIIMHPHEGNFYLSVGGLSKDEDIVAVGSGAPFALSAMRMGHSAIDAVRHAAEMDVYTGGKIRQWDSRDG